MADNTDQLNKDIENLKRQIKEFELNREKEELKKKLDVLDKNSENNKSISESRTNALDPSVNFIYLHLSKIVFLVLLICSLLIFNEMSFAFWLGNVTAAFIPYWILKLILSMTTHQANGGQFKWNLDNRWLLLSIFFMLFSWSSLLALILE